MTPRELNEGLADYLGGELDAEQTREYERALAENPELAAEVGSLRRAMEELGSLSAPRVVPPGAIRRVLFRGDPARVLGVLRYAAVILIGFMLGVFTRDVTLAPRGAQEAPSVRPHATVQRELGLAYARNDGKSGLARWLLAVADLTR